MDGGPILTTALTTLFLALLALAWWRLERRAFWIALGSALIACLAAEGVLRVAGVGVPGPAEWLEPLRLGPPTESAYWPDAELVYSYPTDPRGYFDADGRVLGRVNSLGLRGGECRLEPTPGRTRIALVGDSFTLGIGVQDEDTLPAQLERALGTAEFEVLNFGVSATGTVEQVQYLEGFVLRFAPQVVVLVFFLNDTEREATMRYLTQPRAFATLRRGSYLLNAVVGRIERAQLRGQMLRHYREGYEDQNPAWRTVRDEIVRARALLDERGVELVVAIHPVLVDLQPGRYPFAGIHAKVRDWCAGRGIAVVDLHDALSGQRASELWVHPNDKHPNERANHRSAEHLAAFLRDVVLER